MIVITEAAPLDEPGPRILFVNEAFVHQTGYSREEVIGHSPRFMQGPKTSREELDRIGEALRNRVPVRSEVINYTKSGDQIYVEMDIVPVENSGGEVTHFVAVERDITERRKLEQQFLRAQRLESIGTLAGGIAHDLNNSLGPIILSLDLLKMKFTDPGSQELLSIIGSSAQRGAAMVSQVLSFARGVEGHRVELQVKHVIRDIEKIANETFFKNIQVINKLPLDLWTVIGDPTQLHQVLLNLCVNARDAMPNGGKLTLLAENVMIDAHYAAMNVNVAPGPFVVIEVNDTGEGIAPENIDRIFDPFFTTKEIGKGTGLGLSTTLAIVKSHQGFIQIYSELGHGTSFKVYLPARTESSFESGEAPLVELPRGHGELILVVDDEASVRQITQQTLEAFGYRVVLATDGVDATAVFARRGLEIAAVITDVMMPIMDGPATIQVLRRMNPRIPIMAATGLADQGRIAQIHTLGVKEILPKPYSAETLLKALRDLLADAAKPPIEPP
jgi:PAS domain S-box-containing protein